MKKLLVTIVTAFMTMAGYAQTTFNVRVGGGILPQVYYNDYNEGNRFAATLFAATIAFETNIPLGARTNKWVLSPSVLLAHAFDDCGNLSIPLHFGYKVPIGYKSLFIPKFGPMIGYSDIGSDEYFIVGPSGELAFEIKHFVVAVNCCADLIDDGKVRAFATFGYKF